MRYATTTEDNQVLHRQDEGTTQTLCGIQALYDVDADTGTFGLMAGTLFTCGECDLAAVRRIPTRHGHRAMYADHDDVRAAVQILAMAGYEPARNPDEAGTRARGFLVEPLATGSVAVYRMHEGVLKEGEDAAPVLDACARALQIAGWHIGRTLDGYGITARRPEHGDEITTVTGDRPGNHPF
nr:hypothetical protein OH820_17760 [Streptomyces sp. NBC_00857]